MTKAPLPMVLLALAMLAPGCAGTGTHHHNQAPPPKSAPAVAAPPRSKPIVTLDETLAATVLKVNPVDRYVILDFPDGRLPKQGQHLFLYRRGLKTGELRVAGPQQETRIAADILSGDAQAGDTVRDQ